MNTLQMLTGALATAPVDFTKEKTLPYLNTIVEVNKPKVKLQIKGLKSKYTYNLGVLEDYKPPFGYVSFYLIDKDSPFHLNVILTTALADGYIQGAKKISAISLSSKIRDLKQEGLGYPIYQYLVKTYKKLEGDLYQSDPARKIWVKLSRDGDVSICSRTTKKIVQKNVKLLNDMDGQIWYNEDNDIIYEKTKEREIAINHFLLCTKINKPDQRLKLI